MSILKIIDHARHEYEVQTGERARVIKLNPFTLLMLEMECWEQIIHDDLEVPKRRTQIYGLDIIQDPECPDNEFVIKGAV